MVKALMQKKSFFFILTLIGWLAGISRVTYCFASAENVRALIIRDAASLSLQIAGEYTVSQPQAKKVLYSGADLFATVTAYSAGIMIGQEKFNSNKLLITPSVADTITIDDRRFRGSVLFAKESNGRFSVINYIGLEDYIQGVLYHEASHYWPDEVLKAQAIICRTYALYQTQENKSKDYDVTSDIYSQVYGGRTSERYRLNRAVQQTTGLVLTYKGNLFPAFYHACCGGHTEDATVVWNLDLPPLKGLVCPFCKDSPHFNWHNILALDEISAKLRKALLGSGAKIKDIQIVGRNNSGRVAAIKLIYAANSAEILAKDFRNIIGPNLIKSTNFSVSVEDGQAIFEGLGWGHGVGFCQWGGYFMAKNGSSYEQILKYYYPGVDVSTL
jgi:stage II sporulation protein D